MKRPILIDAEVLPKIKQTGEEFVNQYGKKEKTRKKTGNNWFETQDVMISVQALNPLFVYKPDIKTEKAFTDLVDSILSKKSAGESTTEEENQIDPMVYKLYQLTYDEVLVVDEQPPFSREAYKAFEWPKA